MSAINLFQLLPAVYRMRDAQIASTQTLLTPAQQAQLTALLQMQTMQQTLSSDQLAELQQLQTLAARGPLESLLLVVSEQLSAVAYDLDQLYDNQFIETCAQWVIPYIGDLIGYQSVAGIAPAVDNPRAEVAETISLRRRKGTILVIEQLARDATGWGAHAKEQFQVLADTQYMKHIRPRNYYAPNLRQWKPGIFMDTGFDETAHKVDVRRIDSMQWNAHGQYNIQNIAVFLWSLSAYSVTQSPLTTMAEGNTQCFRFSPLNQDVPLFHRAISQGEQIAAAAGPANVPDRLLRRVLCADLTEGVGGTYYGQGASLALYLNKQLLNPYQIGVADLAGKDGAWANLSTTGPDAGPFQNDELVVLVDPELGRLALADNYSGQTLSATWYYGANANMGGGEYERNTTASPFEVNDSAYVVPFPDPRFPGLQDALTYALGLLPLGNAVAVEISGESAAQQAIDLPLNDFPFVSASVTMTTALSVDLPANTTLELRSANQTVQTLLLDGALTVTGDAGSQFLLNGIVIAAQETFTPPGTAPALLNVPLARPSSAGNTENLLAELTLTDCTLVPGWGFKAATDDGKPQKPTHANTPVLQLAANAVALTATNSILGAILSNPLATVSLTNCIVDSTDPSNTAYAAVDAPTGATTNENSGGAALTMNGCTVVGRVHASVLQYVSDCIFWAYDNKKGTAALVADRRQQGCVRFSFLPIGAVVPAQYECVQQKVAGAFPAFVTTLYGQPGYLKLMACTDNSIRRGADDGSEMGAYHFVMAPQRESDLQIRLQEYVPVGMEFGIVYQT
jgi:hypothetical protein